MRGVGVVFLVCGFVVYFVLGVSYIVLLCFLLCFLDVCDGCHVGKPRFSGFAPPSS